MSVEGFLHEVVLFPQWFSPLLYSKSFVSSPSRILLLFPSRVLLSTCRPDLL